MNPEDLDASSSSSSESESEEDEGKGRQKQRTRPRKGRKRDLRKDAVFISGHKFVGGPGTYARVSLPSSLLS